MFSNFPVVLPDFGLQQKIANFLDIKIAQFDQIISKKEQLIEKLEEAKKSLISEVVTGKVKIVDGQLVERDASEMKDNGVEWLGKIPVGWNEKRVKDVFDLRNERNYKAMNDVQLLTLYTTEGIRRAEDVENKTGNTVRTVHEYKKVYRNDIVVNIILAWMGAIGYSDYSGVISPAYDIYSPKNEVESKYYAYLFRLPKFSGECFRYGRGIMLMRWRTYSDEFRSIRICVPSYDEQKEIVKFIDIKVADIIKVINKNKEQIEKLKQAKQSLISEAVTGKIDLRDWEIIEEGEMQ
jgi:type I restriction enzyme S subunit